MDRFAQTWWFRFPVRLRRFSRFLSEVWADGAYLTAWPKIAAFAPLSVFLFGFLEGATHWSYAVFSEGHVSDRIHAVDFAQMLPLLFVAVICGALSSQLGLLLVAGFALGDVLLAPSAFGHGDVVWRLTRLYAPQAISYYAFALLAVTPTLTAKTMAASLPAWLRKRSIAFLVTGGLVACFVEGVSVYGWTAAAPMIVRVHWLWPGGTPPISLKDFMPHLNPWLPATAVAAMAIRLGLSVFARKNAPQAALASTRRDMTAIDAGHRQGLATSSLQALAVAFITTVTISGLFNSVGRAVWVFSIVLALSLARTVLLPKIAPWQWWGQLANKIPLLLRWAGSILAAFAITRTVLIDPNLAPLANREPGTFGVEIFCFLVSLAVALVLFPAGVEEGPLSLSPRTRRVGQLAVFLCVFVLATQPVYADICLDPFCCFGANPLLAALAIAALVAALLVSLPFLLDAFLFSRAAILVGMAVEDALAALTGSAFAQTVAGRVLLGLIGLEAREAELKAEYPEQVANESTFKPNGLNDPQIKSYLDSPEGQDYLDALSEASPNADADTIYSRAVEQIGSGSEVPNMTRDFTGPLVKIVPEGTTPASLTYSPYFTTQSELDQALASGRSLGDYFGLPLSSQADSYSVFEITPPIGGGTVFISPVAPTTELWGDVTTEGGGMQYLVPNRGGWSMPVQVGTIPNVPVMTHL